MTGDTRDKETIMTGEQWDTYWWINYNDAVADCHDSYDSELIADRETEEQFGPRPETAAS